MRHGLHADIALHGHHGGDADPGQARTQCSQHAAVGRGPEFAFARALAGGEHHQARPLAQVPQSSHQLGTGHRGGTAVLAGEEERGRAVDQQAVGNEVEDVHAVAQCIDHVVERGLVCPAQLRTLDGVAQPRPGAGQLLLDLHLGQAVLLQPGRVGHDHQRSECAFRAQAHRSPVGAAQVAGEERIFAGGEVACVAGHLEQLPAQAVEFGCAGADKEADAQRQLCRPGRSQHSQHFGIGKELLAQHPAVVEWLQRGQHLGRQRIDAWTGPAQAHIGLIARPAEAQFDAVGVSITAVDTQLEFGVLSHSCIPGVRCRWGTSCSGQCSLWPVRSTCRAATTK